MEKFNEITSEDLRAYLKDSFFALLSRPNILEEIETALPIGEEGRTDLIYTLMQDIVNA